jgi:hypothetical protein
MQSIAWRSQYIDRYMVGNYGESRLAQYGFKQPIETKGWALRF